MVQRVVSSQGDEERIEVAERTVKEEISMGGKIGVEGNGFPTTKRDKMKSSSARGSNWPAVFPSRSVNQIGGERALLNQSRAICSVKEGVK